MENDGVVYFQLIYPGLIGIDFKKPLYLTVESKRCLVFVTKHLNPVEILDTSNEFKSYTPRDDFQGVLKLKEDVLTLSDRIIRIVAKKEDGEEKNVAYVDFNNIYHKRIRFPGYTEILIAFEFSGSPFSRENTLLSFSVLDEFIRLYRAITKDFRIPTRSRLISDGLVLKGAEFLYDEKDSELTIESRLIRPRWDKPLALVATEFFEEAIREDFVHKTSETLTGIQKASDEKYQVDIETESLLKAFEEHTIYKNYKYAILDSFIVAESLTSKYLDKWKLRQGVSNKKIKEFKKEVGISYKLNVEMIASIPNVNDDHRRIIGAVDVIRSKRNRIVHDGEGADAKESHHALVAVSEYYELVRKLENEI
jgi:hypothetical protein